jgi:AcrR family transcriptional regulator
VFVLHRDAGEDGEQLMRTCPAQQVKHNTREPPGRRAVTQGRVVRTAVVLADDAGIDSVSMRRLSQELGVVPMVLDKHVANKDERLDGILDAIVGETDPLRAPTG